MDDVFKTETGISEGCATFAELKKISTPLAESVLETLKTYATRGLAVNPGVVISVINKADFNREQLVLARMYAHKGRDIQHDRQKLEAEREYTQVVAGISFILDSFD